VNQDLVRAMDKRAQDRIIEHEGRKTFAIGTVKSLTLAGASVRVGGSVGYLSDVEAMQATDLSVGSRVLLARVTRQRWVILGAVEQHGSVTSKTTNTEPMATPANFAATDSTLGYASLEWDASYFDVHLHELQVGTVSDGAHSDTDTLLTDNSQYEYLANDGTYYARVRQVGPEWDRGAYTDWISFSVTSTGAVADHGLLAGLVDDDHPQYHLKNGFDNDILDNVTMTFTDGTRTFEIAPTGANFSYWDSGVRYTSTGDTVVITDTEGIWFFYYVDAVLTASQTAWGLDGTKVPVALIYWDATNNTAILLAPENHNWELDDSVHIYLHTTFGTRWAEGLAVSDAGSDQLNVTAGTVRDEDIPIVVTDDAGSGWWDQTLSPAELPIFYRDGANGDWRKIAATTTPVYLDTNVLQYNEWTGAVWQLSGCTLNKYIAYWVVCTNNVDEPVVSVPGQEEGDTLDDATSGNSLGDMNFSNLPSAEHKVLARVIVRRTVASPYYSIEQIDDYRNVSDEPSSGSAIIGDHGLLTGLADDDHSQYVLVDGTRYPVYNPGEASDWPEGDPGDADDAIDKLAERMKDLEDAPIAGDASDISFTPNTLTDWDSDADPGNVDGALDQLAERVDDLESGSSLRATDLLSYMEPVTNGDVSDPELVFADGDVVMAEVYF
jgi:hypothetical protein